jgi:hypothetical protein
VALSARRQHEEWTLEDLFDAYVGRSDESTEHPDKQRALGRHFIADRWSRMQKCAISSCWPC